uniref:ATP synthase F0 subunit 8 n=1 Tax=Unio gibbus TaxID=561872 RepID=UPI002E780252|nr:ATP synthase F0 subunit 8 [Unio gibbus]WQA10098.1 ATP synthase F0 subunit 8 [Unio gibbus]
MPQLSPMSWIMVISVFLICLVCFAVTVWWVFKGEYVIKYVASNKAFNKNKRVKWGFGGFLLKK